MIYPAILLILIIESLAEVMISRRNSLNLIQRGAMEIAPVILPLMTAIYLLKYTGSFAEYVLRAPAIPLWWFILFGGLVLAAKFLKFWAISALGPLWTMRVLIVPGTTVVKTGPYRWVRHPNYVAVMTEVIAIPLLGKAYLTAITVTTLFSIVLYFRIRAEENALLVHTDYAESMLQRKI